MACRLLTMAGLVASLAGCLPNMAHSSRGEACKAAKLADTPALLAHGVSTLAAMMRFKACRPASTARRVLGVAAGGAMCAPSSSSHVPLTAQLSTNEDERAVIIWRRNAYIKDVCAIVAYRDAILGHGEPL